MAAAYLNVVTAADVIYLACSRSSMEEHCVHCVRVCYISACARHLDHETFCVPSRCMPCFTVPLKDVTGSFEQSQRGATTVGGSMQVSIAFRPSNRVRSESAFQGFHEALCQKRSQQNFTFQNTVAPTSCCLRMPPEQQVGADEPAGRPIDWYVYPVATYSTILVCTSAGGTFFWIWDGVYGSTNAMGGQILLVTYTTLSTDGLGRLACII